MYIELRRQPSSLVCPPPLLLPLPLDTGQWTLEAPRLESGWVQMQLREQGRGVGESRLKSQESRGGELELEAEDLSLGGPNSRGRSCPLPTVCRERSVCTLHTTLVCVDSVVTAVLVYTVGIVSCMLIMQPQCHTTHR